MSEQEIKNKILEIFKSERKDSTAAFTESNFMDFLTQPPRKKDTLKNSFRGVRKYYRFMDKLELEFGICFSFSDLDTYYGVDQLTKKVLERIKKEKENKMILQKRNEEKEKYIFEFILLSILIGLFYWQGINWVSLFTFTNFGIIIYWTLSSKIYNKRQLRKINQRFIMNK